MTGKTLATTQRPWSDSSERTTRRTSSGKARNEGGWTSRHTFDKICLRKRKRQEDNLNVFIGGTDHAEVCRLPFDNVAALSKRCYLLIIRASKMYSLDRFRWSHGRSFSSSSKHPHSNRHRCQSLLPLLSLLGRRQGC